MSRRVKGSCPGEGVMGFSVQPGSHRQESSFINPAAVGWRNRALQLVRFFTPSSFDHGAARGAVLATVLSIISFSLAIGN